MGPSSSSGCRHETSSRTRPRPSHPLIDSLEYRVELAPRCVARFVEKAEAVFESPRREPGHDRIDELVDVHTPRVQPRAAEVGIDSRWRDLDHLERQLR